jgi:outer membrane receptor for Fe3+-dicitrate
MKKMRRIDLPNRYLMMICIISLWTFPAWAQTTVTGTVKDAGGNSLPGVTVQLKGTTVATTTTNNGTFNISAPLTGTLVFSMIGYGSQEQNINNRSSLNVTLESESELVEEVVVVGYNVVKKSDLTGSVVSINSEDITAMPVQNPLQALQGRAAGLDVTSNERPGEMGSIRVRGERSLLASNSPLYVVDGVPLSSGGIESKRH